MINYFIRPGDAYVKVDTETKTIDLVLNLTTQKTLSSLTGSVDYYNNIVSASANWATTDETTYNANKTAVLGSFS